VKGCIYESKNRFAQCIGLPERTYCQVQQTVGNRSRIGCGSSVQQSIGIALEISKMNMGFTKAIFAIAAIFSLLAAIMAFVIAYEEYKHHYLDRRKVFKASLKAGCFTFVFFLVLGSLLAVILPFCFYREH